MIVIDKITGKSFRTKEEYELFLRLVEKEKEVKLKKTKVIRSGDENFEEEKIKMFDTQKTKRGLAKEKQLRIASTLILEHWLDINDEWKIEHIVSELLKEIKIRVKL